MTYKDIDSEGIQIPKLCSTWKDYASKEWKLTRTGYRLGSSDPNIKYDVVLHLDSIDVYGDTRTLALKDFYNQYQLVPVLNQCDGCVSNHSVNLWNNHVSDEGIPYMACQKHRYKD